MLKRVFSREVIGTGGHVRRRSSFPSSTPYIGERELRFIMLL
jgi:hypothetical protein